MCERASTRIRGCLIQRQIILVPRDFLVYVSRTVYTFFVRDARKVLSVVFAFSISSVDARKNIKDRDQISTRTREKILICISIEIAIFNDTDRIQVIRVNGDFFPLEDPRSTWSALINARGTTTTWNLNRILSYRWISDALEFFFFCFVFFFLIIEIEIEDFNFMK